MSSEKIMAQCAYCGVPYRKRADRVRSPDYCSLACRKASNAARIQAARQRYCETCGAPFIPRRNQLAAGQGRFCSNGCAIPYMVSKTVLPEARRKSVETWRKNGNTVPSGPLNPLFMGRRVRAGYIWVWLEGRGYIQEHRLVAEKTLGRAIAAHEVVHHRNEIRSDNRPENLQVMSRSEHIEEHRLMLIAASKAAD